MMLLKRVFSAAWNFLAALGLISVAMAIGLYMGGFFHYVSKHSPDIPFMPMLVR